LLRSAAISARAAVSVVGHDVRAERRTGFAEATDLSEGHPLPHCPPTHDSSGLHALPHEPQLRLSLASFVQKPPPPSTVHVSCPWPQTERHVPWAHTFAGPHALLHAPQFCGSMFGRMHAPLHDIPPLVHGFGVEPLHAIARMIPVTTADAHAMRSPRLFIGTGRSIDAS
jgi:hypothetical protein